MSNTLISKINNGPFARKRESKVYYLALVFLIGIFIVFTLSGGIGFAGTVGRISGFFILAMIAYGLIDWGSAVTEKHEFWREKEDLDEEVNLRMRKTSKIIERASSGEKTSKKTLSEKIKKTFLIKLKEKRDLTEEEVQELLEDEEEFRRIVQDEVISDYILEDLEEEEEKGKIATFLSSLEDKEEYRKKTKQVIRRVEGWE
ncbi:MAG: hypothetical protein V5A88_03560 [Candidatus Thermoplasmatota archaeon]